jgi:hypothetical protein
VRFTNVVHSVLVVKLVPPLQPVSRSRMNGALTHALNLICYNSLFLSPPPPTKKRAQTAISLPTWLQGCVYFEVVVPTVSEVLRLHEPRNLPSLLCWYYWRQNTTLYKRECPSTGMVLLPQSLKYKFTSPISQEHRYDISITSKWERMNFYSGLCCGLEPIRVKEINVSSLKKYLDRLLCSKKTCMVCYDLQQR